MSFLKDNLVFVFLTYVNILFIVFLAKVSYKIENFDYAFVTLLIVFGITAHWLFHSVLRKKSLKIVLVVLLIAAGAAYYMANINYVNSLFKLYIIDSFNLINSQIAQSIPTDFDSYKPLFILILPLLAFTVSIFASKGAPNTIITVSLAMIITLWYLGYTEEIKKYLFHYVFITLITYCINEFIKKIKRLAKNGIKIGVKSTSIIIYTIVVSLIIAGISNLLPQSYQGWYGSELQGKFYNKFGNTAESGEQKGKRYRYDLSFSGYSNSSGKLGGPITVNTLIAFRVRSDQAYYLRGTAKDFYDGFGWNQSHQEYTVRNKPEDSMLQDSFSNNYIDMSKELMIQPEELNSSTIFTPILSYNVNTDQDYVYYDEASTFISSGIIEEPYLVYFYNLNSRGNRLLNTADTQSFREVDAEFYEQNYKKYLQVPDNISTRVYDLVYSLTKDKRNNFLKVQAIREYLNKKYPYTLKVSAVPEGQEFLDYFLFTEQKGYCTYFATAETLMCRIAGIPARYVEGFNMTEEKDENGLYVVRNENAHAWTEVLYMENSSTGLWYTVDAVPNAVEEIHKEEEQAKEELENTLPEEVVPGIPLPQRPEGTEGGLSGGAAGFKLPPIVRRTLYFILWLAVFNAIAILMHIRRKVLILKSKSIIPLYKYSLDRLVTIGYVQSESIPDMEFISKMQEKLAVRVKEAADLACSEYYGGKAPGEFDKKEYYKFIETEVRLKQSASEYFVKKYYFYKKISLTKGKIMLLYKKRKSS
jgi:hypothetical protein